MPTLTILLASITLIVIVWRVVSRSANVKLERISDSDFPDPSRLWLNMLRLFLILQVIRNSWLIPREFKGYLSDGGQGSPDWPFADLTLRFLGVALTTGITAYLTAEQRISRKRKNKTES